MLFGVNRVLEKFKNNKGLSHSSIYAIGSITRQLVGFVMLPIYTSYLTPANYGLIGLISFAIIIIEAVLGARLMDAVPKFYHEQKELKNKHLVVSSAFWITGVASSIIVILMMLNSESIAKNVLGNAEYALVFSLFAIQTLTQAIEYYGLLYMRIIEKPILYLILNLSKLVVQVALNIWLVVYQELGVLGVAISGVVATAIFALIAGGYCISKTGFGFNKTMGKKMFLFSWPLWLAGLGSIYITSSNRYYINLFSSLDEVGLYELGAKFAIMLLVVMWMPFNEYWSNQRFKIYKEENAVDRFRNSFKVISALLGLGCIGISILSVPVIYWMADSSFHDAVKVVPILVIGMMFSSLADFYNFGFFAKSKTGMVTISSYISVALVTVLYITLTPKYGYIGAAISLMFVQITQFLYSYTFSQKYFKLDGIALHLIFVMIVTVGMIYYVNFYLYPGTDNIQLSEIVGRILLCGVATLMLLARFANLSQFRQVFKRNSDT